MPKIFNANNIPLELRELPRWCCWQERPNRKGGKPGKPPIRANVEFSGQHAFAKTNDPGTWASFADALGYWHNHSRGDQSASGLSFMLNGDGIIGIDLDDCRDPKSKTIAAWAQDIIRRFGSYTEISPSRRGIRIFVKGKLPPGGRRKGQIEVYDTNKALTVTGRKLNLFGAGDGIEIRSEELLVWHQEVFGTDPTPTPTKKKKNSTDPLAINDPPEIDKARLDALFQAKPKAKALFRGDRNGYASQSEVDLALANYASWFKWSEQEIYHLLVAARLNAGEPIKPDDYFERTIAKAREGTNDKRTKRPSRIAELIDAARRGTDDITIRGNHGGEIPEAASMADVAKIVAGVRYLIRDWIPFGMVTMLVGEPGVGKSAFALYGLVRPIITPCTWFNNKTGPDEPGDVLWCDTEGTAAITIERIKNWDLPAKRIKVPFHDDPLLSVNLSYEGHLERMEAVIAKHDIKLVVIDSLRGAHDGDENNSRVAGVLQQLAKIAEKTGTAVVIIHHTRKLSNGEDVTANASRGSNAIQALVRAQLGIDKPDKNNESCRLQMLKENLGVKPKPIGFRITGAGLEFGKPPQRPQKETEKDRAEKWLKANMQPGVWHRAGELEDEAEQDGISETALRRARNDLGIVKPHYLRKTKSGWEWQLPGQQDVSKTAGENRNALPS